VRLNTRCEVSIGDMLVDTGVYVSWHRTCNVLKQMFRPMAVGYMLFY